MEQFIKENEEKLPVKIRGREFFYKDIEIIKHIISNNTKGTRLSQSIEICEALNWRQSNGILKDRACREVMLRLHAKGLIHCPPIRLKPRKKKSGLNARKNKIIFKEPEKILAGSAGNFPSPVFKFVRGTEQEGLWDYLIDKYHYLKYQVLVGHYLKYLIYIGNDLCGCIGFSDAVLKLDLRDKWIKWEAEVREKNLSLVINNSRYLLLPWIQIKYLSSRILGRISRQVVLDWQNYYGYTPVLCETFVDKNRFVGTSYKAANWTCLGETKGKGRSGMNYHYHGIKKDVYIYPLCRNYRQKLLSSNE